MFWRPLFLAALILASVPGSRAAQIYQWTDADGVKHYANQPPPDSAEAEVVAEEIERLEAKRDAVKEKIFTTPRRTRKGVGQDIEAYQALEKEMNALKDTAAPKVDAAE